MDISKYLTEQLARIPVEEAPTVDDRLPKITPKRVVMVIRQPNLLIGEIFRIKGFLSVSNVGIILLDKAFRDDLRDFLGRCVGEFKKNIGQRLAVA